MFRTIEGPRPIRLEIITPGDEGLAVALANDLLALFKRTIRTVNCRDYNPSQIAAWASDDIDPVQWRLRFAGRLVIVARMGDVLAGFADVEPVIEAAVPVSVPAGEVTAAHLDRFYVSASFQRCGVGATMFAEITEQANRRGWKRLFTEASITARPFFQSRGCTVICEQTVQNRGQVFINYRMEWRPTGD